MSSLMAAVKENAQVSNGIRIYAVGDVHGRDDLLDHTMSQIDEHLALNPVARPIEVYLGDYIDRGPDSRQVLDRLVNRYLTRATVCLLGNHEFYMMEFLKKPEILVEWQSYGGLATLASYGLEPIMNATEAQQEELAATLKRTLPNSHRLFLERLALSFTCGDFYFVHAGVRPGVPLKTQSQDDLLWIRDEFLLHEESFGKIVVHGHTPVLQPEIRRNRINIDTGAYATGRLTCLVLQGQTAVFL
jgi:serine/threonine protein phosphatase 1